MALNDPTSWSLRRIHSRVATSKSQMSTVIVAHPCGPLLSVVLLRFCTRGTKFTQSNCRSFSIGMNTHEDIFYYIHIVESW